MPPAEHKITVRLTHMGRGLKAGWYWHAICEHGTSRHEMFGSQELITKSLPHLYPTHRNEVADGCRCLFGLVTFVGGPEA